MSEETENKETNQVDQTDSPSPASQATEVAEAPAAEVGEAPADKDKGAEEGGAAKDPEQEEKDGSDYVKEAFEAFLKGRTDDDEPLSVIRDFYEKNASDELKAKCEAEGKTVEGAYEFMCRVSQKAGGKSISDAVGLSICMHYFQDVPALADFEPKLREERDRKRREETARMNAKAAAERAEKKKKPGKGVKKAKMSEEERRKLIDERVKKDIERRQKKSGDVKNPCEKCVFCESDGKCGCLDSPQTLGHANPELVHCPHKKESNVPEGERVKFPPAEEIGAAMDNAAKKAEQALSEEAADPAAEKKEKPKKPTPDEIEQSHGQALLFG